MRPSRGFALALLAFTACTALAGAGSNEPGLVAKAAPSPNETHVYVDRTGVLPGRLAPCLVDEPARGRVLLYGGWNLDTGVRSDTWEWDGLGWIRRIPQNNPGPRFASGAAYDEAGQRVVLYGGLSSFSPVIVPADQRTWEWNGTDWAAIPTSHTPGVRAAPAMAYDPATKRTLLFGGFTVTGDGPVTDASGDDSFFSFDGKDWTQIPKSGDWPTPRGLGGMAIDRRTGHLVLHGGLDTISFGNGAIDLLSGTKYVPDTWIWDGTSWHKSAAKVDALGVPGLASEPDTGELVLAVDGILQSGLYSFTDDQWQLRQTRPADRVFSSAAWSTKNKQMLVVGGALLDDDFKPDKSSAAGDYLVSSTQPYTRFADAARPRNRSFARMAQIRDSKHLVLLFGLDGETNLDDMYLWNGGRWSALELRAPRPVARIAASLASLGEGSVLLFGGSVAGTGAVNETWIWTEATNTWEQIEGAAPPPRINGALAPLGDAVILFGGDVGSGEILGDTWSFRRSAGWQELHPAASPGPRTTLAFAPAPDGKTLELFGGQPPTGNAVGEAWSFDGTNWTKRGDYAPFARNGAQLATDNELGRLFLSGGTAASGQADAWDFTSTPPQPLAVRVVEDNQDPPTRRNQHGFASNALTGGILLFGGASNETKLTLDDTWQLSTFGASCTQNTECSAGQFCTEGVCCESAACGPCRTCAAPGAVGLCQPRGQAGPEPGCDGAGQACDRQGHCRLANAQTCTEDDACASGTCLLAGRDAGVCCEASGCAVQCVGNDLQGPDGNLTSCGAYGCETNRCRTTCTSIDECADGFECNSAGACVRGEASAPADGCSCRTAGRSEGALGGLLFMAAALLVRGRRRRL